VCREPRGRGTQHEGLNTRRADCPFHGVSLFLVGGAFALAFPFVSVLAFGFAGIIGIAGGASTSFSDLTM
jgi:hypothetical protein